MTKLQLLFAWYNDFLLADTKKIVQHEKEQSIQNFIENNYLA